MLRALCILLLFSFPICGQTAPSPVASSASLPPPPIQYTATDTVTALHRLFTNRRVGGATLLGISALPLVGTPAISVASSEPGGYKPLAAFVGGVLLGAVFSVPIAYAGGHQLSRHSRKKEAEIIAAYKEKHVLSQKIKRKLRPGLFLPTELYAPNY